jgi:hypothetical protein
VYISHLDGNIPTQYVWAVGILPSRCEI